MVQLAQVDLHQAPEAAWTTGRTRLPAQSGAYAELFERVALDERLRQAAGSSFRDYGRRPHSAREQMRVQLAVEVDGGVPLAEGDGLGAAVVAELARAFGQGPAAQPDADR